jgi:hypothetical protein
MIVSPLDVLTKDQLLHYLRGSQVFIQDDRQRRRILTLCCGWQGAPNNIPMNIYWAYPVVRQAVFKQV